MHWLPEGVSTYSGTVDGLFRLILIVTGVAFVLTEVLLFAFAWMYRRREGRRATYTHGNNTLELIWTVVPAVFLVFLAVASARGWKAIKGSIPRVDEVVTITGQQFSWEFRYRGTDGAFDTPDDIVINDELRLPVGRPVKLRLRSKDVIHSFFLPNFRLKQDAVPGMTVEVWVEPTKIGPYEIACAELCGFGHTTMKGTLHVLSPEEYGAWLAEAQAAVVPPAGPTAGGPGGAEIPQPSPPA
jgi:cytochrome c oxidase subunit 2